MFFNWSAPIDEVNPTYNLPDKYIIHATRLEKPMYNPIEVMKPGVNLTLQPHVEYSVEVQAINCAGSSNRASILGGYYLRTQNVFYSPEKPIALLPHL